MFYKYYFKALHIIIIISINKSHKNAFVLDENLFITMYNYDTSNKS